ncbi:hypothetical protein [Paenibacillus sp. SYP-B4298]|uniref:hypothetical protein n=1 Tax=Paenibacillus sp. SYP-B4298 TaxID=2996034 RepID=UPI0022DD73AE|nr:hypothetical protein [Paenibacillus sp. SYP-B4298]
MKRRFLMIMLVLAMTSSLSLSSSAFTEPPSSNKKTIEPALTDVAKVVELKDGSIEIYPYDPDAFIEQMGIKKPSPDAQLVRIKRVKGKSSGQEVQELKERNIAAAPFLGLYVQKTGTSTGTSPDRIARGRIMCSITSGCQNLRVEINTTDSVYAEFSANYEVSAEVVSAGVGYTIGSSKSVTITGSETRAVPYNKYLVIDAYPRIEITGFEIFDKGIFSTKKVGSGSSWRAVNNEMDFVVWIQ